MIVSLMYTTHDVAPPSPERLLDTRVQHMLVMLGSGMRCQYCLYKLTHLCYIAQAAHHHTSLVSTDLPGQPKTFW